LNSVNSRINCKIVFICGANHSGSTLLGSILGSHSKCFYAGETNKTQFFGIKGEISTDKNCKICGPTCRIWGAYDSNSSVDLYEQLSKINGKEIVIDSNKNLGWLNKQIDLMDDKNVKLYLIYLQRDGRAVINSGIRKYSENSVENHINDWIKQIVLTNELYQRFRGEKMKIHYEDLASKADENVRKICEFLKINFEPEMVNYFYFEHHPLGGNTGTLSLIPKAQQKEDSSLIKLTNRNEYYYSTHPLNIKLDLRWKRELKSEYLHLFESLVGELNNDFRMD
jgi:hypothetical protein